MREQKYRTMVLNNGDLRAGVIKNLKVYFKKNDDIGPKIALKISLLSSVLGAVNPRTCKTSEDENHVQPMRVSSNCFFIAAVVPSGVAFPNLEASTALLRC
jgi:hypothetical protein